MFQINNPLVKREAKNANAKTEPVRNNSTVFDAVKLTFSNLIEKALDLKTYNAAHWVCNIDNWNHNNNSSNTTTYKRGDIVFLDLGAMNFKYEPSYLHACIILANRKSSVLIVPCSSKKYNSGYPDIIDATTTDGFIKNTGIQSQSFRWVSKNRIVSYTGKQVSKRVLDQIDKVLISFAPSYMKIIKRKDAEILNLKQQIGQLQQQLVNVNQKTKNIL